MTDTRKDKRAPLSLKVRFKSATVDEFIEQYATDISRGGIYIKSKQPMPIGTLLKFEFQLKDESKLIQGVGRVVWKREAGEGATDANPSGMGIKFIKMDPESKALVEQIVAGRGEAPGQYEAGGGASVAGDEEAASSAGSTAAASGTASGEGKRPIRSAKATMQFFPSTTPQNEMPPPEDRTQVRHASEFLASALSSAGADEATSGEADKSADVARKRTEEIEREREEQQKRAREEEASKARAEKDRQEREKAEAARAEEEKAERAAAEKAAAAAAVAAEKKAKDAPKEAPAKEAAAKEAPAKEAAAKAKPASDEKAAVKPAEKKADDKRPAAAADKKKTDAKPVAAIDRPAPEAPQSNMLPIFALVAAVVLVGGWWMFGRGTDATETDLPPPPPVVADDTPVPPVEPTPPPVEPTVEPTVEPEVIAVPDVPPAPMFEVAIQTTPPGASIFVDGQPNGVSPATVSMTEGAHAIEARLAGYRTGTSEATAGASARPVRITLAALPYAVMVTTTPPGARVRVGGRTVVSPGRAEIPRPTAAVTAIATLAGFQEGRTTLEPTAFVAGDDAMTAEVSIVLTPRPVAPPTTPRTPRPPRTPPVEGTTTTTPDSPPVAPPPPEEHHEAPPPPPDEAPPDNPF